MKSLILSLMLFFIATLGSASTTKTIPSIGMTQINPKSLSLEKAVEESMRRKPSIKALEYSIVNYKRQQKSTYSPYLPNVSLNESFYNTRNYYNAKSSFGIQASETVLNLAQQNYTKLYGTYVSSAQHQKKSHVDDVRFATENAFLTAWLLQQKLPLIIILFNSSKQTFELAKHQYKIDLLNQNDWLIAKTTHANNLTTVNNYRDEIEQAQKNLEYYTGLDLALLPNKPQKEPSILNWKPTEKFLIRSFNYYYQIAIKNRKDLKIKQDAIDSESYNSQYYATQYVPNVSLFGNATRYTSRIADTHTIKEAGIMLSWNVFDGLSNYFNKSAADARKMKAILDKSDTVLKIKLDVQTVYSALQKEIKNLETQTLAYNQANNEFILKTQQYKIGILSSVDYETAKYSWELARYTWMSQAITTTLKHQELLYTCGYPTESTPILTA